MWFLEGRWVGRKTIAEIRTGPDNGTRDCALVSGKGESGETDRFSLFSPVARVSMTSWSVAVFDPNRGSNWILESLVENPDDTCVIYPFLFSIR